MEEVRRRLIATAIVCVGLSQTAFACWQPRRGPTWIRGSELTGRVTLEGRALANSRLQLHRAVTFSKESVERDGMVYEPRILKTVVTDLFGQFSFGHVPPGKYWIVMRSPSVEKFAVGLVTPEQGRKEEQLWIKAWGDWCTEAIAELAPTFYYQDEFEAFERACGVGPEKQSAKYNSRMFAKHEVSKPWREYTSDQAEEAAGWLDHATVSLAEGKVRLVSLVLSSESGDWYHNIDYCFRPDGSLRSLLAVLNSFHGNYSLVREVGFDSRGVEEKRSNTYYMLGTLTTMSAPPEVEDMKEIVRSLPLFRTTDSLPFADLLAVRKAHAPTH